MLPQTNSRVTASKTLTDTDLGVLQYVAPTADAQVVLTLPTAAPGKTLKVVNGGRLAGGPVGSGSSKSVNVVVRPAGSDTMTGNGFTPAAAKGASSAKATHLAGDYIKLVGGTGTWYVAETKGTWSREA